MFHNLSVPQDPARGDRGAVRSMKGPRGSPEPCLPLLLPVVWLLPCGRHRGRAGDAEIDKASHPTLKTPVSPKGNQPWIFIGKPVAEVKAPILWPSDAKSWFIGKDPDAGKDGVQEEKGVKGDGIVGWHHWLNGHEFGQTLGDGEGQGSLGGYSPGSCKESDMTERLNNNFYKNDLLFKVDVVV